jgi:WD40 repeat protein
VGALAALPDGRIASGSEDRTVRVWRLDRSHLALEATLTVVSDVTHLAYDGGSKVLVAGDWAGRLHFLEFVPSFPR